MNLKNKVLKQVFHNTKIVGSDFLSLFYPQACEACGANLLHQETTICTLCLADLPLTGFENKNGNTVEQVFWGRVRIESACSLFYFKKGSKYQGMMHRFKYQGAKQIGIELGKLYGSKLAASQRFTDIDCIVPIPLHTSKFKKRGYNQSECIAQGIAEILKVPVDIDSVVRTTATATQTRKSRLDRWENVETVFEVTANNRLANKHILLIDDILTTGATLDACASKVLEVGNTRISIGTLAFATN